MDLVRLKISFRPRNMQILNQVDELSDISGVEEEGRVPLRRHSFHSPSRS